MKFSDFVIIFIGLVILIVTGSMLFFNINIFNLANQLTDKQVGVIELVDNDVRKRPENDLVWKDAIKNQGIELNDTIFTGSSSTARIRLKDETVIKIDENTLIVINDSKLELKGGSFISDLGENSRIDLLIGGESKVLTNSSTDSNTKVQISVSKEGTLDVNVLEGQLKLKSNNVEKVVDKNKGISQKKAGKLQEYSLDGITLISPDNNVEIFETRINETSFSWKSDESTVEYLFELSSNKNFETISYSHKTTQNGLKLLRLGKEKIYYWRVSYTSNDKSIRSELRRFRVKEAQASRLITPSDREQIEFLKNQIVFSWEDTTGADIYSFELSKSEDFVSKILSRDTKDKSLTLTIKEPLTYFWRIIGKYSKTGREEVSKTQTFTLLAPIKDFTYVFPSVDQVLESNSKQTNVNFKFSQNKTFREEAGRYQIIVNSIEGSEEFKSEVVTTNQAKINLQIGKYTWKIRDFTSSEASYRDYPIGSFDINYIDKIDPPSNLKTSLLNSESYAEPLLRFSWTPYNPELNVKFELRDETNAIISTKSLEKRVNNVDLTYSKRTLAQWRVSHINSQGKVLATSSWQGFDVNSYYNRESIKLRTPSSNAEIKETADFVKFEWENKYPSSKFKLNLYKSSLNAPVFSKNLSNTSYKIKTPKAGKYYWQIIDLDTKNPFIKETKPQEFNLVNEKGKSKNKKINVEEIFPLAF